MNKGITQNGFLLVAGLIIFLLSGCNPNGYSYRGSRCDTSLLASVPSPDETLLLSTYHSTCGASVKIRSTGAAVEKPRRFWQTEREVVCSLASWNGFHPIEAAWQDNNNIKISSSDHFKISDIESSDDRCKKFIAVTFEEKIKPQRVNAPNIAENIKNALEKTKGCIDEKLGTFASSEIDENLKVGRHRSALELTCSYLSASKCPISQETYNMIEESAIALDLDRFYLESIKANVER